MRKPVGVKCVDSVFLGYGFPPSREWYLLTPSFHPHSSRSGFCRPVQVGRSRFSRYCHLTTNGSSYWRHDPGANEGA